MQKLFIGSLSAAIALIICATANAQASCACPPLVPPVPSCNAPAHVYNGCAEQTVCNNSGKSCNCDDGKCSSEKCCRPLINIDFSRKVTKTRMFANPMFGGAPPTGFTVSSMPFVPLNVAAIPTGFATTSNGLSDLDRQLLVETLRSRQNQQNNSTNSTSGNEQQCSDLCGQQLQLRRDVDQLIRATENLSIAVQELAKQKKDGDSSNSIPEPPKG